MATCLQMERQFSMLSNKYSLCRSDFFFFFFFAVNIWTIHLSKYIKKELIEYLGRSSGGRWENLVWRSGLCDWCRGCMLLRGAVSVLVRGTVKSLKWRLVFTKDQYSAHCSSSLCLKPYHESYALESPERTSMPMTLLSSLNRLRNMSGGSWLGKKQWRRKDWE